MKHLWLLALVLSGAACKQSLSDAVVPLDDFAAGYAAAVCENLTDCCDQGFDPVACQRAGKASMQAHLDALAAMPGAVYHADLAVSCLDSTAASASRCAADFTIDCPKVFENASPVPDAGVASVELQCMGELP